MNADVPPSESPDQAPDTVPLSPESWRQAEAFCSSHRTRVLTIFFSDLVGSTLQQSDLGNLRAAEVVRKHRALFRDVLSQFDGVEVETAGDSFLAVFAAPSEGVRFALHLQSKMARAREADPDLPAVRVGLHQGQVVVDEHGDGPKPMDIYGLQVSTAARIMDLAQGGQILCSRSVFDDARAILGANDLAGLGALAWENYGPYRFKGVHNLYEVCEVREDFRSTPGRPIGSEKSHPADHGDIVFGWRPGPDARLPKTNWAMERRLGEGGFGEVWLAYDANLDSRKTVFKFCTRRSKVESLQRELHVFNEMCARWARAHPELAASKPTPPGIVEVRHSNSVEAPYFIELEYVSGGDLRQWIDGPGRDAPLPIRLRLALRLIKSVIQVHEAGFVHRDIKPSNYLIVPPEDPRDAPAIKLTDFGIGQEAVRSAIDSDEEGTDGSGGVQYRVHSGSLEGAAGTYFFIAPELLKRTSTDKGKLSGQANPPADIFSLGVTLFQLFTGSTENVPGPGLTEVSDDILREDIGACLNPKPEDRPTAAQLLERLERYTDRVRERELAVERAQQRARIRRLRAIAASVALVAGIIVASVVSWYQLQSLNRNRVEGKSLEYKQALRTARDKFFSHGPSPKSIQEALDAALLIFKLRDELTTLQGAAPENADLDAALAHEYSAILRAQLGDSEGSVRDYEAREAILAKNPENRKNARSVRMDNPYALTVFDLQVELFLANEHLKALLLQNDLLREELQKRMQQEGQGENADNQTESADQSESEAPKPQMTAEERARAALAMYKYYVQMFEFMTREWARVQDFDFMASFQALEAGTYEKLKDWDSAQKSWEARIETARKRLERSRKGSEIVGEDKDRLAYNAALALATAQRELVSFFTRREQHDRALEAARNLVRSYDVEPELEGLYIDQFNARRLVAAAYVGLGQHDAASNEIDEANAEMLETSLNNFRSAWSTYAYRYQQSAWALSGIKDYSRALEAAQRGASIVEAQADTAAGPAKPGTLQGVYLTLSWYQLMTGQYGAAEATVAKGLALELGDMDRAELTTNRAHALLFQERVEEAVAVYEEWKDKVVGMDDEDKPQIFAKSILEDFELFEKAGITHPKMADIRKSMEESVKSQAKAEAEKANEQVAAASTPAPPPAGN